MLHHKVNIGALIVPTLFELFCVALAKMLLPLRPLRVPTTYPPTTRSVVAQVVLK